MSQERSVRDVSGLYMRRMVGANGFEPSTSWSRTRRASQAALRPDVDRTRKENDLVAAEKKNSTREGLGKSHVSPCCLAVRIRKETAGESCSSGRSFQELKVC